VLQVVSDANAMLTPFLPHAAQRVFETLGGTGIWAAQPEVREVVDDVPADPIGVGVPELGHPYPVITGDYTVEQAVWRRTEIVAGTPLEKPSPLFAKLDPALGETGPEWAPIVSAADPAAETEGTPA
jgi:methionyl-tRNA synthetase